MKNDNVKSVVVLFACCLVVALLLAGVNTITAPIIDQNNQNAQFAALEGLIPDAQYEEKTGLEGIPQTINGIFVDKNGGGAAIVFSATSSYSSGPMQYAVGIDADGKILAIKKIAYMESKDFGSYPESFVGKEYAGIDSVEAFSGVTYSSNAFKASLKDAFTAYYAAMGGELKETEIDILNKLFEGLTFKEIETSATLDPSIAAVYRADASTYAFKIVNGENINLVVANIYTQVIWVEAYEGDLFYMSNFVPAMVDIITADIISKVFDGTTEFEYVKAEPISNTIEYDMYGFPAKFTAKSVATFKIDGGHAVLVESNGYNKEEKIVVIVSFDNEGKIFKTAVISHGESDGYGKDHVVENKEHTDKYISLDDVPNSPNKFIDSEAHATYSYVGYHSAIRTAYLAYQAIISE